MELVKNYLKKLAIESLSRNNLFKRNLLKEYLQIVVLDYIYSHPIYSQLSFYGGSCLSHCYNLPRLSEDLDFVDTENEIDISSLTNELNYYFSKNTDLPLTVYKQKFRIYLKFPILHELNLTGKSETDLLYLKIEIDKKFDYCKDYKNVMIPLFKFNRSILIKTFDLSTLMATKIRALFYRKWEKIDKEGKILIKVKGRDYFDLLWFLEKNVKPNLDCLKEDIKDREELSEKLRKIVENVDSLSIQRDLEAFIENSNFVRNLSQNISNILKSKL